MANVANAYAPASRLIADSNVDNFQTELVAMHAAGTKGKFEQESLSAIELQGED